MDDGLPVVLDAQQQLLQDLAALLQLRDAPVWERQVVHPEAALLVGVQEAGDAVLVEFPPGAEHEHVLHTLGLQLSHVPLQVPSDIFVSASWQSTDSKKLGALHN